MSALRAPSCASECRGVLVSEYAARGIEAHVTHVPPLQPSPYEELGMRCPHGVLWFAQPTSEQIARWAKERRP